MKQVVKGLIRAYKTPGDRRRAHTMLKRSGYNYFVGFHDTSISDHPFALNYGNAGWVEPGADYSIEARRNIP